MEWKDTESLGRTGKEGEERVSSFMSITIWNAWSSGWRHEELTKIRIKGKAGTGVISKNLLQAI